MAKEVIKKDGTKEPFDTEKIKNSIAAAAVRTDLSEERRGEVVWRTASSVIQMAGEKEEITTSEIKEKILSELNVIEPAVAESWKKYEEEKRGV